MVALEAWALGRPVLANGRCDVLKGQCIRSNAGLYYEDVAEFIGTLEALEQHRWLAGSLGRNGRQFFRDHYDWPVVERKYLEMFDRLKTESPPPVADPLPGWFERRRQDRLPAEEVLARVPRGPALGGFRHAASNSALEPGGRTHALAAPKPALAPGGRRPA
jgi:hypothetical protein